MQFMFDEFTLDTASQQIDRCGERMRVPRKVFVLVSTLLLNRDRALGRDELIRALWRRPDVSDNQLAKVVTEARQLLGDSGEAQRLIRTVPGFGYHWVGPVRSAPGQEGARSDGALPPAAAAGTGRHPQWPAAPSAAPTSTPDRTDRAGRDHADVCTGAGGPGADAPDPATEPAAPAPDDVDAGADAMRDGPPVPVDVARPRAALARGTRMIAAAAGAALLLAGVFGAAVDVLGLVPGDAPIAASPAPSRPDAAGPESEPAQLQSWLEAGRFDDVRLALSRLSPADAGSAAADLLRVELDLRRGRWNPAAEKIRKALDEARSRGDYLTEARLQLLAGDRLQRMGAPAEDLLAAVNAAIAALSRGGRSDADSRSTLARAHLLRAVAYSRQGLLDEAGVENSLARELYAGLGRTADVRRVDSALARTWMRQARLSEALGLIERVAAEHAESGEVIAEIFARNTAVRIQTELLMWREALANSDRAVALLKLAPESERRVRVLQLRAFLKASTGDSVAAFELLEDIEAESGRPDAFLVAYAQLRNGDFVAARATADHGLADASPADERDVLFESREGLLMIRMVAALEASPSNCESNVPALAIDALREPKTVAGMVAAGVQHLTCGRLADAEASLADAARRAKSRNHWLQEAIATELLIALFERQGRNDRAYRLAHGFLANDPGRLDGNRLLDRLAPRLVALAN